MEEKSVVQLEDTVQALAKLKDNLKQLVQVAVERVKEATALKQEYEVKLADLTPREEAVTSKEGKILAAEELDAKVNNIQTREANLANDQRAFEKESASKKIKLEELQFNLDQQAKSLEEQRVALALDKKEYKNTILRKLAKEQEVE